MPSCAADLALDGLLECLRSAQSPHGSGTHRPSPGHCLEYSNPDDEKGDHIPVFRFTDTVGHVGVFIAVIVKLVYLNRARHSLDTTFDTWPVVLNMEIVQNLSIITACVPCLKPFMESLESGMLRNDDLRRRGTGGGYGYGSHNLTDLSSKSSGKKEKSHFSSNSSALRQLKTLPNVSTVVSVNRNEDRERDGDSQKSSSRIIKYTRTWAVE
ncbi:MAG: hypothetical protein Q9170_004855 [Blastenia crenularia]